MNYRIIKREGVFVIQEEHVGFFGSQGFRDTAMMNPWIPPYGYETMDEAKRVIHKEETGMYPEDKVVWP